MGSRQSEGGCVVEEESEVLTGMREVGSRGGNHFGRFPDGGPGRI